MDTQTSHERGRGVGLGFSEQQPNRLGPQRSLSGFANLCYFITFVKQGPKQRSRTALLKERTSADAEVVV